MRKLLSSTVLGGALLFTVVTGANLASASAFQDLSPNSDWAVSKIESQKTGAQPYCALARRFTNDVVLTFARNKGDETSIAIDFQKSRLNKGQYYSVNVDAGFGQTREFNIKPVSDQAVVIKIGSDYAFLEALSRSAIMKADIEGHQYAFNMKDFSSGQSKMNGCLASLVEPAAGGNFDEPIVGNSGPSKIKREPLMPIADTQELLKADPVDSGYVSKITESEASLAREVDSLKEDNTKLRKALEAERRNFENKFMEQSQDSSAMIELNEKVQLLEVENGELREKVNVLAVQASKPAPAPVVEKVIEQCEPEIAQDNAMMRELDMLRDENNSLNLQLKQEKARSLAASQNNQSENKAALADKAMLEGLNERITLLEQENRTLKSQLSTSLKQAQASKTMAVTSKEMAALQSEIDQLQFENTNLNAKLEQQKIELSRSNAQNDNAAAVAQLEARVSRLLGENERLSQAMENVSGNTGAASAPFLVSKLNTLETKLQNTQRERDALLAKMDSMNQDRENQAISISSDKWNLEQATRRYNEAEREVQRLGLELEKQRSACNSQKREIEYMLFNPEIATQEQIARLNNAEEKAAKAEALLGSQKIRYEEKMASISEASERMKRDIYALEDKLAATENEFKNGFGDYQQKLAARESDLGAKIKALATDLAAKNTEIDGLKMQMASIQSKEKQEDLQMNAKLTALEQEKIALEKQQQATNSALSAMEQEKVSLESKQGKVTDDLAALEREKLTLESKLEKSNAQLVAMQRQHEEQISAMKVSSVDMKKLQQERDFLVQKTAELEKDNVRLSQDIRNAEKELSALDVAKEMNVIEASAGGDNVAAEKVEREALPVPATMESKNANADARGSRTINPYNRSVSAQGMEAQEMKVASKAPQGSVTMAPAKTEATALTGVSGYLDRAGIAADQNNISQTENGRNFAAYSWEVKGLYGSAEQQMISGGKGFEDMVFSYLADTENRCAGDFASVPATDEVISGIRVSSYEIACVSKDISASASIVFIEENGQFTAIAHEAGIEYMDYAMDMRDKLVGSFDKTELAAR